MTAHQNWGARAATNMCMIVGTRPTQYIDTWPTASSAREILHLILCKCTLHTSISSFGPQKCLLLQCSALVHFHSPVFNGNEGSTFRLVHSIPQWSTKMQMHRYAQLYLFKVEENSKRKKIHPCAQLEKVIKEEFISHSCKSRTID